jgi:hypothetical protein
VASRLAIGTHLGFAITCVLASGVGPGMEYPDAVRCSIKDLEAQSCGVSMQRNLKLLSLKVERSLKVWACASQEWFPLGPRCNESLCEYAGYQRQATIFAKSFQSIWLVDHDTHGVGAELSAV